VPALQAQGLEFKPQCAKKKRGHLLLEPLLALGALLFAAFLLFNKLSYLTQTKKRKERIKVLKK
jgi:hypothetical protein